MADTNEFFHRPDLAVALADQALDTTLGKSGGLFLSAPRRTGKSTFVRQDLLPELARRGVVPIYVDLWIDRSVNPAIHISNAVRTSLAKDDGPVATMAKKVMSATNINLGALGSGVTFDLSQLNMARESTLADALKALSLAHKRKLVLVIDEAQHATSTQEGEYALFALKAARDSLNTDPDMFGMQLIATGSNRDKLAAMVSGREQAFYGAEQVAFPALSIDYVRWALERAKLNLDVDKAFTVFTSLGFRPEPMIKALKDTRLQLANDSSKDPSETLAESAAADTDAAKAEFLNSVANLPPLQSAVLREIAKDAQLPVGSRKDGVFTAKMKARLEAQLEAELGPNHGESSAAPNVQSALDALRGANLLWKSKRGSYAMEDEQYIEWITNDSV